jgi:hypothetical protein
MVANTLGDLTRRGLRFAHPTDFSGLTGGYFVWGVTGGGGYWYPTLPTLRESSGASWSTEHGTQSFALPTNELDFWTNIPGHCIADDAMASGSRIADDVILTNVIGFDVKAWDPDAGAYVDLGYQGLDYGNPAATRFGHRGANPRTGLRGSATTASAYDTWSTSHFSTTWNDGLDNDGNGLVDDDLEKGTNNVPPYPVPLRGIQVRIRVFEPDSKQIREVTVVQEFLPR